MEDMYDSLHWMHRKAESEEENVSKHTIRHRFHRWNVDEAKDKRKRTTSCLHKQFHILIYFWRKKNIISYCNLFLSHCTSITYTTTSFFVFPLLLTLCFLKNIYFSLTFFILSLVLFFLLKQYIFPSLPNSNFLDSLFLAFLDFNDLLFHSFALECFLPTFFSLFWISHWSHFTNSFLSGKGAFRFSKIKAN